LQNCVQIYSKSQRRRNGKTCDMRGGRMINLSYGAFPTNFMCEDSSEATSNSKSCPNCETLEKIVLIQSVIAVHFLSPSNIHLHAPSAGPSPPGIIYYISFIQTERPYHAHIIPIQQNLSQLLRMFSSMSTKVSTNPSLTRSYYSVTSSRTISTVSNVGDARRPYSHSRQSQTTIH
jgi:hypothetical protein